MKTLLIISIILSSSTSFAKKENLTTGSGRYQLIQLSDMRRDQYLLDTHTGKMWNPSCLTSDQSGSECAYSAWLQVEVENISVSSKAINDKAAQIEALVKQKREAK